MNSGPETAERDRSAVIGVLDVIDRAADQEDWPLLRSMVDDQLTLDLGNNTDSQVGGDEFVANWRRRTESTGIKAFHMRSNYEVTIDDDAAHVTSKVFGMNVVKDAAGLDRFWEVWAIWDQDLRRTPEGWRMCGMEVTPVIIRGEEPKG